MRFDEFLDRNGFSLTAVGEYDGYLVQVAVPADWEPVDTSSSATPVWIWRDSSRQEAFCANAVLTLARASKSLDPTEVFAMLCEWQLQILLGVMEIDRDPLVAHAGPGVMGTLDLLINTDAGIFQTVVMSRIIATGTDTLTAQLTVTAPLDSAFQRSRIGFGVIPSPDEPGGFAGPAASLQLSGAPAGAPMEVQ